MRFFRDLIFNLGLLLIIALVLFFLFPDMMRGVFQLYSGLFGPVLILIAIGVA